MIPRKTDDFAETAFDSEVVVMRLSDGDFFSLQGTAKAIWELIDGVRDRDAIVAALAEQFGAIDALGNDVDAFLRELAAAGLLA